MLNTLCYSEPHRCVFPIFSSSGQTEAVLVASLGKLVSLLLLTASAALQPSGTEEVRENSQSGGAGGRGRGWS
jgi:hypothetical protein